MSVYQLNRVETTDPYISKFIDQDNKDTTALFTNRNQEQLTVTYTSDDGIFSVVNGLVVDHIKHDNSTNNVSQVTTVADKHNHAVFAYEHGKNGSDEKWVSVNWYDRLVNKWKVKTIKGTSPLLLTDEYRDYLLERAEVILYYIDANNSLSYFLQSDGFTESNIVLKLRNHEKLTKIGITKNNRIQLETIRPVTEITYSALLGQDGLPILDKNRNPIWVASHYPIT